MLFEVLRDKQGLMCTNEINCIYDKDTLTSMYKSGHRFKLNGKAATVDAVIKYVKENTPKTKSK